MELKDLLPYKACRAFKEMLSTATYLDDEGVEQTIFHERGIVDADSIYVGASPSQSIPDNFITIMPNGYVEDIGDLANQTIILGVHTKLIDRQPQIEKSEFIIERISNIVLKPRKQGDYWFSIANDFSVAENINVIGGYNTTLININIKIL